MADQFDINVRSKADISGAKQQEQALKDVELQARKTQAATTTAAATPTPRAATPAAAAAAEAEAGASVSALGSLIGSFAGIGILGAIEFIAGKIQSWAENLRRTAEEQRSLNREIDQAVRSYEKIRTPEQWDRENEKIEEQIQKLRDRRAVTTDSREIDQLNQEIAAYERQQTDLAILARRGLERAQIEQQVAIAIRGQIIAIAEEGRASERAQAAAEKRAAVERELTDERARGKSAAVDLARDRGEITDTQAVAAKAKIQRDADNENFNRSQRLADQKVQHINDEIARTGAAREEAQKNFDEAQRQQRIDAEHRQNAPRLAREAADAEEVARKARASAQDAEERRFEFGDQIVEREKAAADEAQRQASLKRILADTAARESREAEKRAPQVDEELKRTKAILEERQRQEEHAKGRAADIPEIEAQKKAEGDLHKLRRANQDEALARNLEDAAASGDAQARAVLNNRAAAQRDRQLGQFKDAELLEQTARDLLNKNPQIDPRSRAAFAEADRLRRESEQLRREIPQAPEARGQQAGAQTGISDKGVAEIVGAVKQLADLWR